MINKTISPLIIDNRCEIETVHLGEDYSIIKVGDEEFESSRGLGEAIIKSRKERLKLINMADILKIVDKFCLKLGFGLIDKINYVDGGVKYRFRSEFNNRDVDIELIFHSKKL